MSRLCFCLWWAQPTLLDVGQRKGAALDLACVTCASLRQSAGPNHLPGGGGPLLDGRPAGERGHIVACAPPFVSRADASGSAPDTARNLSGLAGESGDELTRRTDPARVTRSSCGIPLASCGIPLARNHWPSGRVSVSGDAMPWGTTSNPRGGTARGRF